MLPDDDVPPVVEGALVVDDVPDPVELRVDEPVVDRVPVVTPIRAFTPESRLITRLRVTPPSTTTPLRRRRSMTVVLLLGAVA